MLEQVTVSYPDGETKTLSVGSTEYISGKQDAGGPSEYYGYTFVDGGAYKVDTYEPGYEGDSYRITSFRWEKGVRQIRLNGLTNSDSNKKQEPFFGLKTFEQRQEYQWRTLFYTGGALEMYGVNVSVLSDDAALPNNLGRLVLGDPRTDEPDQEVLSYSFTDNESLESGNHRLPNRSGFEKAPVLYPETLEAGDTGGERSLRYYYSTEKSERTRAMIAPGYRISSMFSGVEYGGNTTTTQPYCVGNIQENWAKYRCATYQEDGFPAGRWRLPTMGEIYMLAKLSTRGAFPRLFNSGNYWSANGVINVNTSNGTVSVTDKESGLLRCVYDTWYWGDDQTEYDKWRFNQLGYQWNDAYTDEQNVYLLDEVERKELRNQFVWGDKPRR